MVGWSDGSSPRIIYHAWGHEMKSCSCIYLWSATGKRKIAEWHHQAYMASRPEEAQPPAERRATRGHGQPEQQEEALHLRLSANCGYSCSLMFGVGSWRFLAREHASHTMRACAS